MSFDGDARRFAIRARDRVDLVNQMLSDYRAEVDPNRNHWISSPFLGVSDGIRTRDRRDDNLSTSDARTQNAPCSLGFCLFNLVPVVPNLFHGLFHGLKARRTLRRRRG